MTVTTKINGPFAGCLVPVLTPFDQTLAPDVSRFVDLCTRLLDRDADGLALFGTTSEANSMCATERKSLLESLRKAGVSGDKLMVGVGACSVTESSDLLVHAAECDAAGALLLPPFYYKNAAATDDGLFDFAEQVIRRTAGANTKIYLYSIPPIAHVGWSVDLVGRLSRAFPDRIVGIKDSSGDWSNTKALIDANPGFAVFPGSEAFLLPGLRAGGLGCITATGNLNLPGIRAVYQHWQDDSADELQQRATDIRMAVQTLGLPIAVMKAYFALKTGDENWSRVRPPLRAADRTTALALDKALQEFGFQFDLF